MNQKPQGVVSYAGLDVSTLLAGARLMFTGDGGDAPCRLASLMPLFPAELIQSMPFVGVAQPGQAVAPGGFSIDPAVYHCLLQQQEPRLYAGDNLLRNQDAEGRFHGRGVVTVDEVWTTCFPQYQPYAGERLTIYPLGGGAQCAAVPESLYPRAAALLRSAETALGITGRCHDYAHYVYQRIRAGETFDADLFETEYLTQRELAPVSLAQRDLGRLMQDLAMLRTIRDGSSEEGLYTEDAKRAEHLRQYVPGLYACDVFEDIPQSRRTTRLLQPMWEEGFVSDWWLCCQDASAYVEKDHMTLDMAALCQGFQLAPVYDPVTRGGRYPDRVRMITISDKELRLRTADTLNNPAYGSGMSPQGTISKLIYLPNSRELLRQGKLRGEEAHYLCVNTSVAPAAYREMTAVALLQEQKGQLVDALYRRESVMGGVTELSPDYASLRAMMNRPVEQLEAGMRSREMTALSGYDADLDYLRRMGMEREWKPLPNQRKTFRFAPDALRQASIESGFAMRSVCLRFGWQELETSALPDATSPWPDGAPDDPVQPLWQDAADPCCLTTDVGGLYPTDEESAAGAVPPLPASGAAVAEQEQPAEKPAKPKKKKKKSSKKPAGTKGSAPFSEEELLERQVPMKLPEPLPGEVGTEPVPADGDEAADGAAAVGSNAASAAAQTDAAGAAAVGSNAASDAAHTDAAGAAAVGSNAAPGAEKPAAAAEEDAGDPEPSLQQLKNGQLSFRFDELS